MAGRAPTHKALLATAALVWIGKRMAGETLGFEEASAGLSLMDVVPMVDEAHQAPGAQVAPDPTPPGSGPGTVVAAPVPVVLDGPSPGQISPLPSSSTDLRPSTSGPA